MRSYKWFSCLVMFCLIVVVLPGCNNTPEPSIFKIDPTHSYPFEGWGTSLAWWAEVVGHWSDPTKRADLEDALFNPDTGLGLNVIRYNFGASTPNDNCPPNSFRIGGNVPTYQPRQPSSGDDGYDWTQDQAQVTVLREGKDRGANIFEGFANSAPAWMLENGCPQGNGGSNNLSPTHEEDYAHYLATIVQHFHDDLNITFRTIEPFNEPDEPWWNPKPKDSQQGQEGMHVDLSQQERVIQDLHTALQQNGAIRYASISAADNNSVDKTVRDYNSYDTTTQGNLAQLNTHSYSGSQRDTLYRIGQQNGKRIWMSEDTTDGSGYLGPLCIQSKQGTTSRDLFSALELSCQIGRDLRTMHPQAWVYWQAVETSDDPGKSGCHSNTNAYGLLQTPFCQSTQMFKKTKQYYAMAQYSRFIRPGYQILQGNETNTSDDTNTITAYDPSSHLLIIVEKNNDPNTPRTVTYDLSNFNSTFRSATPYLTSASQNIAQQSSISISSNQFTSIAPPNSITTYVITNASVSASLTPTPSPTPPTPIVVPTPTQPPTATPTQRTVTSQQTQSQTVNATGQRTTPGTQAKGTLRFRNPYHGSPRGVPVTYDAGTVFDDDTNRTPNVQMMIDATITVPGDGTSVTVPAHVVQIGTIGNIPINGWTSYVNNLPVDITNITPFTGGTDPQSYTTVQQGDIDTAANSLKASTRQSALADLKSQLRPNEHLVGDPQCTYNVTSDRAAGDQATTVTVTVKAMCTATAST